MTLSDIFSKVTVAMDEIDLSEYQNKIYHCADSVQREIAAFADPITRYQRVESIEGLIRLPDDCYEVVGLRVGNVKISFTSRGDHTILAKDGKYDLKYHAYPKPITKDTPLSQSIEISKEGGEAMVYGICAGLCINDEPELYSAYMNRYNGLLEAILQRKRSFPFAEIAGGVML